MNTFWGYMARMNLFAWIAGIFVAHGIMYFALGTATWLSTTFLASAFYAVVLFILKAIGKKVTDNQTPVT